MGSGYYDRTFQFVLKKNRQQPFNTNLIGLAHSFQEVEKIPVENWDVPLRYIVTEKAHIKNITKLENDKNNIGCHNPDVQ